MTRLEGTTRGGTTYTLRGHWLEVSHPDHGTQTLNLYDHHSGTNEAESMTLADVEARVARWENEADMIRVMGPGR